MKTTEVPPVAPEETALTVFQPNTALKKLPPMLQEALKKFKVREAAGFAPQWKPKDPGEYLVGTILSVREAETEFGLATIVTMQSQQGQLAIFLGTELKMKLEGAQSGQHYVIQFDGMETKKQNPKLKNDMKKWTVIEVDPTSAPE
jgi:hypothetical protein